MEVRRRIQAGANAWRNVEGVMVDRKISRKLKRKVPDSCVVPYIWLGDVSAVQTATTQITSMREQLDKESSR